MTSAPTADRYALAARIATALYGGRPIARWVPSEEADVFVLELGGARPPEVLKLERAGSGVVAKEQRLLPFLRGHGLEVPAIERAAAGGPGAAEPVAWSVMAFVPSRPLPALRAADPAAARRVAARLGDFVARLLAVPLAAAPLGWPVAPSHAARLEWWARRHATLRTHPARCARYERVFARARALLERPPACLGHGQGYQLRADGRGPSPSSTGRGPAPAGPCGSWRGPRAPCAPSAGRRSPASCCRRCSTATRGAPAACALAHGGVSNSSGS